MDSSVITGDGRKITVKDVANLYRQSMRIPTPFDGRISNIGPKNYLVTVKFQCTDCDTGKRRKFSKDCLFLKNSKDDITELGPLTYSHLEDVAIDTQSDNGNYRAILRADNNQQVLEIWDSDVPLKSIFIKDYSICTDPIFSSMKWSRSGKQDILMYVAHAPNSKGQKFFDDSGDSIPGDHYNYEQSWGETISDTSHTYIVVINVGENFRKIIIERPDKSLWDPVFCDNDTKVACISLEETPRRYGLAHYNNRPSELIITELIDDGKKDVFSHKLEGVALHTLRVNRKGDRLLFLSNCIFGAHNQPSWINILDILDTPKERPQLIHDTISQTNVYNIWRFQEDPLNINNIPINCFSEGAKQVYLTVCDTLQEKLLCLDVDKRQIEELPVPTSTVTILDLRDDLIMIRGSNIETQPIVSISSLNRPLSWFFLNTAINENDIHVTHDVIGASDQSCTLSSLFIKPDIKSLQRNVPEAERSSLLTEEKDLPTIVMVHGGPHALFVSNYFPRLIFYLRLGLRVLQINYRGSYGVDQKHNDSICGSIGTVDVQDCLHVLEYLKKKHQINFEKLSIHGGSHGGFIASHLSCQDSIKFTSAVIRNPVIDLNGLLSTSDTPDWIPTEGLGIKQWNSKQIWKPEPEHIAELYERSPTSRSKLSNVPTLLCLGKKDLRVPMSQGLRWADDLKANNVEVLVKVYDDGHVLNKPETDIDFTINSALWVLRHLPNNS